MMVQSSSATSGAKNQTFLRITVDLPEKLGLGSNTTNLFVFVLCRDDDAIAIAIASC